MQRSTTVVLVVVAVAVLTAATVPASILASHDPESTDYTVSADPPAENASGVTYTFEVALTDNFGNARSGFEEVTGATFSIPAGSVGGCQDAAIDSFDDYTLTVTEPDGQQSFEDTTATFDGGTASIDVADSGPDYRVGETLILELDACVTNPEAAGWYQADVHVEGTAFGSDELISLDSSSHYYPICEGCDNDSAARGELGAPPPEDTPTPTPSPTPTATPEPTPTPTPEPTPTDTDAPDEPTPTESGGDTTPSTATATGTPADGGGTFFGLDPMVVVAIVAAVSIGLAAFGATRL